MRHNNTDPEHSSRHSQETTHPQQYTPSHPPHTTTTSTQATTRNKPQSKITNWFTPPSLNSPTDQLDNLDKRGSTTTITTPDITLHQQSPHIQHHLSHPQNQPTCPRHEGLPMLIDSILTIPIHHSDSTQRIESFTNINPASNPHELLLSHRPQNQPATPNSNSQLVEIASYNREEGSAPTTDQPSHSPTITSRASRQPLTQEANKPSTTPASTITQIEESSRETTEQTSRHSPVAQIQSPPVGIATTTSTIPSLPRQSLLHRWLQHSEQQDDQPMQPTQHTHEDDET